MMKQTNPRRAAKRSSSFSSRAARRCLQGLMVLTLGCLTVGAPAQGQPIEMDPGIAPISLNVSIEELSSFDLTGMSAEWWKTVRQDVADNLGSSEKAARERSMQAITFLATHYPEEARFPGLSGRLYEIYRLDTDEQFRILALSALCAIGHEDTMRHLARSVKLERSARVRRLTLAALAEYFGAER